MVNEKKLRAFLDRLRQRAMENINCLLEQPTDDLYDYILNNGKNMDVLDVFELGLSAGVLDAVDDILARLDAEEEFGGEEE